MSINSTEMYSFIIVIMLMIISPGANQILVLESGLVLGHKSAIYNSDHPDLVRLKREISALLKTLGLPDDSKDISKQLQTARDQLAQAYRCQRSDCKPDISGIV